MSQEKRLFRNLRLAGNFTNESIKLGNIYRLDDGDFVLVANITDFDPSINIAAITDKSTASDRKMQSTGEVKINTKANASSPIGDDEIELLFKKADSGIVYMKSGITYSLKYGVVQDKIWNIWKTKGYNRFPNKYCFCNQIIEGESGTVLISKQSNNRVVLKHKGEVPIGSANVLLEGKLAIEVNSKKTSEIISPNPFVPVFQSLRFKANGQIEVIG